LCIQPQKASISSVTQTYTNLLHKVAATDGSYLMKAALKSPGYLVRNPYSFCFRMIVPKDLRKFVGKSELRYTLRTGNLRDAKHKAKLLAGQVQLIFKCLRKEHKALSKLSDDQMKQLVHQYIKNAINSWDKYFYEEFDEKLYPPLFTDARGFHDHLKFLDYFREDLIDCLKGPDQDYVIFDIFCFENHSAYEILDHVGLGRDSIEEEWVTRSYAPRYGHSRSYSIS
jgi:hypothetical protein